MRRNVATILRNRNLSRSLAGDIVILLFLCGGGIFMALPLVYAAGNAFKPLDELFLFPPRFVPRRPTFQNFTDLFLLMEQSWIPLSRYFFNSVFIVSFALAGNLAICSIAAYVLSKHDFPGRKLINEVIILSLMFSGAVTVIPNYLTLSWLGFIDSYWAIVVPAWAQTLGLYLMKKFIDSMVHDSLIQAARIDGAGELTIFARVVMPIVKPAWLTLIIINFQVMWRNTGDIFIYSEQLKPLPYALSQVAGGGIARVGAASVVTLFIMAVPIGVFIFNQSRIVETMGTSGMTGE